MKIYFSVSMTFEIAEYRVSVFSEYSPLSPLTVNDSSPKVYSFTNSFMFPRALYLILGRINHPYTSISIIITATASIYAKNSAFSNRSSQTRENAISSAITAEIFTISLLGLFPLNIVACRSVPIASRVSFPVAFISMVYLIPNLRPPRRVRSCIRFPAFAVEMKRGGVRLAQAREPYRQYTVNRRKSQSSPGAVRPIFRRAPGL